MAHVHAAVPQSQRNVVDRVSHRRRGDDRDGGVGWGGGGGGAGGGGGGGCHPWGKGFPRKSRLRNSGSSGSVKQGGSLRFNPGGKCRLTGRMILPLCGDRKPMAMSWSVSFKS